MPIFMDRHFIEGASKQAIEAAHKQDLDIQGDFDVNLMTYWFDEARSTAFCLAEAPNAEAIRDLHAHSHGSIPNEVIEVDPLTVQAFLGRIDDPIIEANQEEESGHGEIEPAFRSIMFTDLKDSTKIAVQFGDEKAMHLLRIHNAMIREEIRNNNGREVKTTGDGFLISFENVVDAIGCAIAIQESFNDYNENNPEVKLFVRIGVASGEPIEEKGDLFGTAVILAARLCAKSKVGGVLIADSVRDEIEGKIENLHFAPGGKETLKGFDLPIDVHEVIWE